MNNNDSDRRLEERLDKLEKEMEEIKSMLKDRETEPEVRRRTNPPPRITLLFYTNLLTLPKQGGVYF